MNAPRSILFVGANLGGGGAERALVNLVNHLDRDRFRPHLALFQKQGAFLRAVAPDVPIHELQPRPAGFLRRNWMRARALQRVAREVRPALVMSVLWQVNMVAIAADALFGLGCPLVVNEQAALDRALEGTWRRHPFWPLAGRIYRRAARVVAASSGLAAELRDRTGLPESHFHVIHNPISIDDVRRSAAAAGRRLPADRPRLVAAGRLEPQKNYPLLLRAIRRVSRALPVRLFILGEGTERAALAALIAGSGLASTVELVGFQENPHAWIAQADLFVLSSDFEGFGNVVAEALALGVPVVATDCRHGPREILGGGAWGRLVPTDDEERLAEAILALLGDPVERRRLAEAGRARGDDFSIARILPAYERLFLELIGDRGAPEPRHADEAAS
ncbi:MAG: glycosyltransferase [Deltaproteobacteria bacterium]|nr:glycosyltransferase [Deltaproteobacteria bacterium]